MFRLHESSRQPKVSAFGQGGLGYPNPYNFFNNEISPFGIFGVRVNWNIWDWGKRQKEQEQLRVQAEILDAERESILQNFDLKLLNELERIRELNATMEKDLELIEVRQEFLNLASLQFDEGIITSSDYIEAVNDDQAARLNLNLHSVQLELAKANYLNQKGIFFPSETNLK